MAKRLKSIKEFLVGLGPDNWAVHVALTLHARQQGFKISFKDDCIFLIKDGRELVLSKAQYVQVPWMLAWYDFYFKTIEGESADGRTILNFSKPGLHRYAKSQASFYFPSIPEDDVMDAYIHVYRPKPGDVVWDVGAHAGATSYFLSQIVGPNGRVYAFEPDEHNYGYLKRNIELHNLENVIPVKKAISGSTGNAKFNMDGSMSAGLLEYIEYSDEHFFVPVCTITLADACSELGEVPNYIKMDIEGAETAVVESSRDFLATNSIHFAIESNHRINGELTSHALERLFISIGYIARSSDEFGEMFTWATPRS
jgi:FkbM family methyltransferase